MVTVGWQLQTVNPQLVPEFVRAAIPAGARFLLTVIREDACGRRAIVTCWCATSARAFEILLWDYGVQR